MSCISTLRLASPNVVLDVTYYMPLGRQQEAADTSLTLFQEGSCFTCSAAALVSNRKTELSGFITVLCVKCTYNTILYLGLVGYADS